jgi:hypothetical protein
VSDDFTRGWHEGYRAARRDALSVVGYGPAGREPLARLIEWSDGCPPADVAEILSQPPVSADPS